jgi:arginyl-tRNA synthetase
VHGFYHDCYVMGEGIAPELTQARLWLVEAARIGLVIGLDVVGVSAPTAMEQRDAPSRPQQGDPAAGA